MTEDKAGNMFRRVVAIELLRGTHTQQHDPDRWGYMLRTGFGSDEAPHEYSLVGVIVDTYLNVANDEGFFWMVANPNTEFGTDTYYYVTDDVQHPNGLTFTAPTVIADLFAAGNLTIFEVELWQKRGVDFAEAGRRIWSTVSHHYYCTRCENLGSFTDPMDAAVGFDSGSDAYCLCPIGQDAKAEQEADLASMVDPTETLANLTAVNDVVASHLAANDPDAAEAQIDQLLWIGDLRADEHGSVLDALQRPDDLDDVIISFGPGDELRVGKDQVILSEAEMDAIDEDFDQKFDAALDAWKKQKEGK